MIPVRLFTAALGISLLWSCAASAQTDRVRTTSGTRTGEVTDVSALGVKLERSGKEEEIPTSEIRSIQFGGEPTPLTQARVNAVNGAYEKALGMLDKIDVSEIDREEIKQEVAYYKAYCSAKRALLGEVDISDAGQQLNAFVRSSRGSFHFLEANTLMGDLLAKVGKYDAAQSKYELLARTPWPSYKTRSAVLVGEVLQAEGKHEEAVARFTAAASMADDTPQGKQQLLAANLGKAVSLAATGKVDEGVKLVRGVIADAAPEEAALHAKAYNTLGGCYLKANQPKDALFAYLHVDLLYNNQPEEHAESLHHLATLWDQMGKSGEARQARQTLRDRYASSSWARQ